jgi:hypothetical protein
MTKLKHSCGHDSHSKSLAGLHGQCTLAVWHGATFGRLHSCSNCGIKIVDMVLLQQGMFGQAVWLNMRSGHCPVQGMQLTRPNAAAAAAGAVVQGGVQGCAYWP